MIIATYMTTKRTKNGVNKQKTDRAGKEKKKKEISSIMSTMEKNKIAMS